MKIGYTKQADTDDLHPAGAFAAVCTRVLDLGDQESTWNGETKVRPMLRVYWQTEHGVVSRRYTASMYERSALRRDLESWRGKRFTDQEADAFDTDSILKQPALLTVMHRESNGRTFANVGGVAPLPSSMSAPEPPEEGDIETW